MPRTRAKGKGFGTTVSRAPIAKLEAFRKRMGWGFRWVSSLGSDFNYDFGVFFTEEQLARNQAYYNYDGQSVDSEEWPGVSVFYRDADGGLFHTYPAMPAALMRCYARGIDALNGAYQYLDLVPKDATSVICLGRWPGSAIATNTTAEPSRSPRREWPPPSRRGRARPGARAPARGLCQ